MIERKKKVVRYHMYYDRVAPKGPSPRTRLSQKFILLLTSITIGLCLSEYAVRKFKLAPELIQQFGSIRFVENPKMVYEFIPHSYLELDMANAQGFYDKDFTFSKPENLIRIVMLGDSITQGYQVALRGTFSSKLEVLLNQRAEDIQSPLRYEVMNFGVGGYNLEAEVELLKEKALLYHPDIVVLNIFFNDNELMPGVYLLFTRNCFNLSEEQQISFIRKYVYNHNSLIRRLERGVLYRSKLYLFLGQRLSNIAFEKTMLSEMKANHSHTPNDLNCIYRGFREIAELKKRFGFKFLICIHPSLLYREDLNDYRFASAAKSFNFDYFHMFAYYKKEGISADSLQLKDYPDDYCHPNELGHLLIARALLLELKKHDFIDPKL